MYYIKNRTGYWKYINFTPLRLIIYFYHDRPPRAFLLRSVFEDLPIHNKTLSDILKRNIWGFILSDKALLCIAKKNIIFLTSKKLF
jgi:hypothetical protein